MNTLTDFPAFSFFTSLHSCRAVLFDMDGTILNSEPLHALAIAQLLEIRNIRFSVEEIEKRFKGMSDTAVFHLLKKEQNSLTSTSLGELQHEKDQRLKIIINQLSSEQCEQIFPRPIRNTLLELREKKFNLGLVTASEKVIVELLRTKFQFERYFGEICDAHDTYQTKPSPSPYLKVMRSFKAAGKETFIFEDSVTGIRAATLAGANVYQANWF